MRIVKTIESQLMQVIPNVNFINKRVQELQIACTKMGLVLSEVPNYSKNSASRYFSISARVGDYCYGSIRVSDHANPYYTGRSIDNLTPCAETELRLLVRRNLKKLARKKEKHRFCYDFRMGNRKNK